MWKSLALLSALTFAGPAFAQGCIGLDLAGSSEQISLMRVKPGARVNFIENAGPKAKSCPSLDASCKRKAFLPPEMMGVVCGIPCHS